MTKEEIMQIVQESLLDATAPFSRPKDPLSMKEFCLSFAERIAAAEREACLNLCYNIGGEYKEDWAEHNEDKFWERCLGAEECADAIRARREQ